ncbi:MAG: hypothetical protein Q4D14_06105 [Bacteroidales bacterium]|nr:hypothetical protein [Bacteroidales bacterium]
MNNVWKNIVNAIKKVVGKLFTRTTATFLLFLVLAFALWLLQKESTGEFNVGIPVAYVNKPGDIRIDSELPNSVSFSLKVEQGNALSLFRRRSHDTIYIDLDHYKFNSKGVIKYPSDSLIAAASELYQGFSVRHCTPSFIDIHYSRMRQKVLKVVFSDVDSIQLAPLCTMSGPITVYPSEITVYGTNIDTMTVVRLKHIKQKTYDSSVTERIPIVRSNNGVAYSDTVVRVKIPVERAIEHRVVVPIEVENQPVDTILHIFPSEIELTYYMPLGSNEPYNASAFKVSIDYKRINMATKSCQVEVTSQPDDVSNIVLDKSEVSVLLEKLDTRN